MVMVNVSCCTIVYQIVAGKGIKTATITERNGNVVCITTVTGEESLMIVTNAGVIIRLDVADISQMVVQHKGVG